MDNVSLDQFIRRRPSVHQICVGAFLQSAMFVSDEVMAVPLGDLGTSDVALLIGNYVSADLQVEIKERDVAALKQYGQQSNPCLALVWHPTVDAPATTLVPYANERFDKARRTVSWVTGDAVSAVGVVVLHMEGAEFQVFRTITRRRQRFHFSGHDQDLFELQTVNVSVAGNLNQNLGLCLQMFHDAAKEDNPQYRIVRLYGVLECLSADHKSKTVGSRDAIRTLLSFDPGRPCNVTLADSLIVFDLVAVAGRLRDKLFHGAILREENLCIPDRGAFRVIAEAPHLIADELQWRIEHAIALRAANLMRDRLATKV